MRRRAPWRLCGHLATAMWDPRLSAAASGLSAACETGLVVNLNVSYLMNHRPCRILAVIAALRDVPAARRCESLVDIIKKTRSSTYWIANIRKFPFAEACPRSVSVSVPYCFAKDTVRPGRTRFKHHLPITIIRLITRRYYGFESSEKRVVFLGRCGTLCATGSHCEICFQLAFFVILSVLFVVTCASTQLLPYRCKRLDLPLWYTSSCLNLFR